MNNMSTNMYRARKACKFQHIKNEYKWFQEWVSKNGELITSPTGSPYDAVYLIRQSIFNTQQLQEAKIHRDYLIRGGWVYVTPAGDSEDYVVYFTGSHDITLPLFPTISKSSIRLPKLSYLITLTPEDFFLFIKLLTNGHVTAQDKIVLDFGKLNIANLGEWPPYDLLDQLPVNYRIKPEYAMEQWINWSDLSIIADLDPTPENQLYVMQYLTALTQRDLWYFPADSAVELAQDWDQITDSYVHPEAFNTNNIMPNTKNVKPWRGLNQEWIKN